MNTLITTLTTTWRAAGALLLLVLALSATSARAALATPPQLMSYQGFLTDANGNPLGATNTGPKNYNVVFRVWDVQTGGNTNTDELYAEQQTVTVNNGYFSVLLGQGTQYNTEPHTNSLAALFYSTNTNPRYVEITVLGIGVSGGNITILPRLQLLTSPYAFLAANAVNAGTATTLVNNNNSTQVVSVTNGLVGIGAANPAAALDVENSGFPSALLRSSSSAGTWLDLANTSVAAGTAGGYWSVISTGTGNSEGADKLLFAAATSPTSTSGDVLTLQNNGNVGIDNSAPATSLEVGGSATIDGTLFMKNAQVMSANNASGTAENFLWPRWNDNVMYLNYGSSGLSIRNNASTPVMFMQPDGNVNLGNLGVYSSQPDEATLAVSPSTLTGCNLELLKPGSTIGYQFVVESGGLDICEHNVACTRLYLQNSTGRVGIGTGTPQAGLDVEVTGQISGSTWSYARAGVPFSTTQFSGSPNIDIYTSGAMGATVYYAFSDARIKNIVGLSSTAKDLTTLRGIQVTDFTYKDVVAKGAGPVKKVIAQQVEKVYPQAVSKGRGVVPDIYHLAPVQNGWVQLATDLKAGERVRLLQEQASSVYEVLAVTNGAFQVDLPAATRQVFVYGREVEDFRTVDYEALAMLNVSATQELAKRLDNVEAREARLAALEQKAAQVDDLEAQVADLKKLVAQLAEAAKNSKLTADKLAKSVNTASLDR